MIKTLIDKLLDKTVRPTLRRSRFGKRQDVPATVHGIDPSLVDGRAIDVVRTLKRAGYEAYIVGGAVRDLLLGLRPKDFDVATNATPEQVKALFRRAFIIGRRFRIVHVVFGRGREHEVIEVSTFRAYLDANAAEAVAGDERSHKRELAGVSHAVDASGRVLRDNVWGPIEQDAARRDFTINAMYYDPETETVVDFHHGIRDARKRVLRMIGDPATRYREDPVRIVRAVRFAAKLSHLGFKLDEKTRAPMLPCLPLLADVPPSRLFDEMLKLLQTGHAIASIEALRANGLARGIYPLLDVVVARGDDGTPWRVAGILAYLSTLHEYQRAASLAEQVFRYTHEAVLVTDAQGCIVRVNDAFGRLTGYAPDEVLGRNPSLLASGRHDRAFFAAMWNALQTQGHWSGEIWNRRRDGALMANWMTISVMRDPRGEVQGYVGVFHDITQRKQTEAELQRTALTDALTGLGNRVLLHDRLQQAMARTARHGACLAVVMLDLDGFKAINDTHGHAAGDRLLIALAQRLRALVREVDTVVRLGGDEFVLLLPDLIRPQDAEPLLQRILQAMAQPVDDAAGALQVSASVGVTYYPQEPPVDADTLLHQADEAMYWAKRSGRNRYAAWTPALANNGGTSSAASAGANHQP